MNLAHLALRTVLYGRPRAWTTIAALAIAMGAPGFGGGRLAVPVVVAGIAAAHTALQALARRRELASLRALGMRKSAVVLLLELEVLWITCLGALPGIVIKLLADGAGPRLPTVGALIGAGLLGALAPAIQAARHDVARGLALIPAHQEG